MELTAMLEGKLAQLGISPTTEALSEREYQQRRIDRLNAREGSLNEKDGVDCPICRNKGIVYRLDENGCEVCRDCECVKQRRTVRNIRASGMEQLIDRCTFESFRAEEQWQKTALRRAEAYSAAPQGWFIACGQVGAGKTHLCTAICAGLMRSGREVRFMPWRETSSRLKSLVNSPDYAAMMQPYKTADVLYIDDMFKTQAEQRPTGGDVNLAFELINYRYNNRLTTVISTEKTRDELISIDEGTASRIIELTTPETCVDIGRAPDRNRRIRVAVRRVN